VDPDGPPCICGNHGCLETSFSARSIEAEAFAVAHRGCASRLTTLFQSDPSALTCEPVFQAAQDGDELARRLLRRHVPIVQPQVAGNVGVVGAAALVLATSR
jgi:glucokinase